jgi:hypothetical protein
MPRHFDNRHRIVSVANLEAMCRAISSMTHRYAVVEVSSRFASVEYSNPGEYGDENPMTVMYPMVPVFGDKGVLIHPHRIINDTWDGEGWQAFTQFETMQPLAYSQGKWVPVERRKDPFKNRRGVK